MIFATPDFGTSASLASCLCFVWIAVLALVAVGIGCGIKLVNNGSAKARVYGLVIVAGCGMVPICCCLLPAHLTKMEYGNYPLGSYPNNKIEEGMTKDEVAAILGTPHNKVEEDDGDRWYYWIDSFGIHWCCVRFDRESRVSGMHGN